MCKIFFQNLKTDCVYGGVDHSIPTPPVQFERLGSPPILALSLTLIKKVKMSKEIKSVGMLHIPGKNDNQWKKHLKENKKKQQVINNLWYQLP